MNKASREARRERKGIGGLKRERGRRGRNLDADLAVGLHALELLDALLDDIALDEWGHHGGGLRERSGEGRAERRDTLSRRSFPKRADHPPVSPLSLRPGFGVSPSSSWDGCISSESFHLLTGIGLSVSLHYLLRWISHQAGTVAGADRKFLFTLAGLTQLCRTSLFRK